MSDAAEYRDNVVPLSTATLGERGGGSGLLPPGGGGVEARLARVESDVAHIQSDVTQIKSELKELSGAVSRLETATVRLDERLKMFPTKEFIDVRLIGFLAIIAALVAFGDQIRALV